MDTKIEEPEKRFYIHTSNDSYIFNITINNDETYTNQNPNTTDQEMHKIEFNNPTLLKQVDLGIAMILIHILKSIHYPSCNVHITYFTYDFVNMFDAFINMLKDQGYVSLKLELSDKIQLFNDKDILFYSTLI